MINGVNDNSLNVVTSETILASAPNSSSQQRFIRACPVCKSRRLHYTFSLQQYRVVRCADCNLLLLNPQPSEEELTNIYSATYFLGDDTLEGHKQVAQMKASTAQLYLREIKRYRGTQGGRLLEIGCGQGDFLVEAQHIGYDVTGVEISSSAAKIARERLGDGKIVCGEIESVALGTGCFDVCVLSDVIEHVRDPLLFLQSIRALLKPGGVIFIATPSLSSWSARLLRQKWMEFKPEHLTYFDNNTIQNALFQAGYHKAIVQSGRKILNLDYITHHFVRYPVIGVTPVVQFVSQLIPRSLRKQNVPVVASGMMAFARTTELQPHSTVSVIVPAYNEAATFEIMLNRLLQKTLPHLNVEIIIVESGSSDGTREIALRYKDHPRVTLVLEERPQGKGHAVRTGLEHAKGEFILIQDADLEYDLEDYDVLLEPLVHSRAAFVLGSRHGGNAWKMRQFADQQLLSSVFNFGHWFFTMLVNVLFAQHLKDPFTMYKVFRRDCLYGLTFECNRFDFDYELLIKLVRKGYEPIEIPVNYRSRSFHEGKKVSMLHDPLTWLRALVKLRLSPIAPLREIERQRSDAGVTKG